jgi:hypothetical protein
MNKTLSLIEEDVEEEFCTNKDDTSSADRPSMGGGMMGSLGGSQKIFIEDTLKDLSLQSSPQHI